MRASSRSSPSSSSASTPFASTASTNPRSGSAPVRPESAAASGWRVTPGIVPRLPAWPRSRGPARGAHARARRHPLREPARGGDRSARRLARAPGRSRPSTSSDDAFVFAPPRREGRELVVLAGHYDTVPAQDNLPGPDRGRRRVRPRRERHEGRARGAARAGARARGARRRAGRRPRAAALRQGGAAGASSARSPRLFDDLSGRARGRARDPARADRRHHPGRLPRQPERAALRSTASAATRRGRGWRRTRSRPRSRGCGRSPRSSRARSRSAGSRSPRCVSITQIARRHRRQRDPRPRDGARQLPLRARPLARRAPRRTCARSCPTVRRYEAAGDSPPARVVTDSPLVQRLRRAGGLALEPKQAWTNVADFTSRGIDAVNFGPGATRYAHRRDEQVEIERARARVRVALATSSRVASDPCPSPPSSSGRRRTRSCA